MSTLIEEVNQRLQADGGRMTAQRRTILETLQSLSGHPTVDQIYQHARRQDSSLNRSTVYRTLRWLEKEQLVSSHHLDEKHQDRFEPPQVEGHHHFRCRVCGTIIEFTDPQLEMVRQTFEDTYSARVDDVSIVFSGLCPECKT